MLPGIISEEVGENILVHELGHSLGAAHDGEVYMGPPDREYFLGNREISFGNACSADSGHDEKEHHLMTPDAKVMRNVFFDCSSIILTF